MRSRRIPYVACFLLSLPLALLWALATPVMAVVDDPAQIAAAVGAVRGEFHQPSISTGNGEQQALKVPGKLAALAHVADCLVQSNDTLPTQCSKAPAVHNASTVVPSTAIRYPPLFYWAVGWTTLIFSGLAAYWSVTIVAAIINSALLALGLWAILNFGRRAAVLGWMVCLVPEVLYLMGTANDSGFEIAAAIAAWSCVSSLVTFDQPSRRLVVASTVATCAFVLARPASPVWALIMLGACAVIAGWERIRSYLAQRALQVAAGVIAASGLAAFAWRLYVGAPNLLYVSPPQHTGRNQAIRLSLFGLPETLKAEIGVWLNTFLPFASLMLWMAAFALLLLAGIALAPRRLLLAVAGIFVCVIAIPVIANVVEFNRIGYWWQGRDGIPFGVGLPILLGLSVPDRLLRPRPSRRLVAVGIGALGALNLIAFVWILHRYAIGEDGPWRPSTYLWEPPGGVVLLSTLFLLASVVLCLAAWRWMTAPVRPIDNPNPRLEPFDGDLVTVPATEPSGALE